MAVKISQKIVSYNLKKDEIEAPVAAVTHDVMHEE
ncbi:MAG: hypothetical protein ACI805_002510, partial [Candidatus Azotimanducaceae bacterium]